MRESGGFGGGFRVIVYGGGQVISTFDYANEEYHWHILDGILYIHHGDSRGAVAVFKDWSVVKYLEGRP